MNKALLIGINKYPGCPLRGCINDVNLMRTLLINHYNFRPENIIMLLDSEATRKNIMTATEKLVAGTVDGDKVVFDF